MPSPFPGMNPYLEQPSVWADFHNSYLIAARDALAPQVDPSYFVATGEHVYVREWPVAFGIADTAISESAKRQRVSPASGVAVAEPKARNVLVSYPTVEEERALFLEIRDRSKDRVVTIIEMLSPANKYSGPDRDQYIAKRQTMLMRDVNLVEIDLLRGGPKMPDRNMPASDYSVLVSRPGRRPLSDYWAFNLREKMPGIPIPLRSDDDDAALDLQALLHRVYDAARYGSRIYRRDPDPALATADADWARTFVPARS